MKKLIYSAALVSVLMLGACGDVEEISDENVNTGAEEISAEEEPTTPVDNEPVAEETPTLSNDDLFSGYKLIEVDGGDLSGYREAKVVVDIGFGDREYWAFTNVIFRLIELSA